MEKVEMKEYIEREAVLKILQYLPPLKAEVERIPIADVRSVIHGKWIKHYGSEIAEPVKVSEYGSVNDEVHCSHCGAYLGGSAKYEVKGKYCPNCGADML